MLSINIDQPLCLAQYTQFSLTVDPHWCSLNFRTYHKSSTRRPRQWAIYVQQYYLISTATMTVKYASSDVPRLQRLKRQIFFMILNGGCNTKLSYKEKIWFD